MASTLPRLPLFEDISKHDPASTAVVHSASGRTFTYGQLLRDISRSRRKLEQDIASGKSLEGERVAFLVENGYDYVVTFLAIRAAQGIAVPLSGSFPVHELQYVLDHSQAAVFLSSEKTQEKADELMKEDLEAKPVHAKVDKITEKSDTSDPVELRDLNGQDKGGLMLYTSGTTSRPKGVLLPGAVLTAQARSLIHAWQYTPRDRLLHVLPLHHIHGTMNALLAPLHAGSSIEFLFPFTPDAVWNRFAAPFLDTCPSPKPKPVSFFTVVPTIYSRLLSSHPNLPGPLQAASRTAISPPNLRLAISGSAALPTPTRIAWSTLSSGNTLLERYGMTECGMALSCGLADQDRVEASVGWPLPTVQVRLVDTEAESEKSPNDDDSVIKPGAETDSQTGRERHGEIQLRGPTIFQSYFRNPTATASEFVPASPSDPDQSLWFKTGDVAVRRPIPDAGLPVSQKALKEDSGTNTDAASQEWAQGPAYFIQGRASADIIKTGGEKVSALEVEREMLSLREVAECAVVGVPSAKWGQKVGAVVVLSDGGKRAGKEGKAWGKLDMRRAMKERLVAYKCPMEMRVVETLPRNAMGKINKKTLVGEVFADKFSPEGSPVREGGKEEGNGGG